MLAARLKNAEAEIFINEIGIIDNPLLRASLRNELQHPRKNQKRLSFVKVAVPLLNPSAASPEVVMSRMAVPKQETVSKIVQRAPVTPAMSCTRADEVL